MQLADRIDAIEAAYEFMLAYAAQGRRGTEGGSSDEIREQLVAMSAALDGLAEAFGGAAGGGDTFGPFVEVLAQDAGKAQAAVGLALAQPAVSSQLVDNLNASIHLRALLTDMFLIDEALKAAGAA